MHVIHENPNDIPNLGHRINPDRETIDSFKRLWLEVIYRAISDMENPTSTTGSNSFNILKQQAKIWLHTNDFKTVCDLAGINPNYLKKKIEGMGAR